MTWSHICELIKIDDELERSFYEKECYKEKWDVRILCGRGKRSIIKYDAVNVAETGGREGIIWI